LDFVDGRFVSISDDINFEQALWNRAAYGVSTCSNHVERIHRTCNGATKLLRHPLRKLKTVIEVIETRFDNAFRNPHKEAKSMLAYIQNQASKFDLSKRKFNQSRCQISHCEWSAIYSNRFEIPNFPCIHNCIDVELVFLAHSAFAEFVPEERIIERQFNGSCIFRTRNKVNRVRQTEPEMANQFEHINNAATIEDTSPFFNSSTAYLYELTKEIITGLQLQEGVFYNIFSKISMEWSLFLEGEGKREDDIEMKSEFKYAQWAKYLHIPNPKRIRAQITFDHLISVLDLSEDYEEEDVEEEFT
jgi:hypothetical protein